jgi:hypothetical protein
MHVTSPDVVCTLPDTRPDVGRRQLVAPRIDDAPKPTHLRYSGSADVGLWYSTSGRRTLDNGRIGAFEEGNPSFHQGSETAIDRLSPPAASYNG